jgi:diguanylate cyclase (GGDEF)-like protein
MTRLILVRLREDEFRPDEMLLLHGMAWILDLVLRQQRLISALNERQRVLEQVSRVQRAIASREPLPEVLQAVTNGASNLLGSELSTMHLVHDGDLGIASMSASSEDHLLAEGARRLAESVADTVLRTDTVTRIEEPGADHERAVAMGAPVRENDAIVGSLVVVSWRQRQSFSSTHEQSLLTFADQVSLALSDARLSAIAQQAFRDPLTGLATRTHFLEQVDRALRRGSPIHVLFLDLDHFKEVNDTMGHVAGDDVLRQVGRRLTTSVHEGACVARLGGDEFAVLLENASDTSTSWTAQRMLSAITHPFALDSRHVNVGVSIGIASGELPVAASDLLHEADIAMYRSKRLGGGRITESRDHPR